MLACAMLAACARLRGSLACRLELTRAAATGRRPSRGFASRCPPGQRLRLRTGRHVVADARPSGTHVAYVADVGLSAATAGRAARPRPIAGTEGRGAARSFRPTASGSASTPTASSRRVAGHRRRADDAGARRPIRSAASWGADDTIVFGQRHDGHLASLGQRRHAGDVIVPSTQGELAHGPQLLPDGDWRPLHAAAFRRDLDGSRRRSSSSRWRRAQRSSVDRGRARRAVSADRASGVRALIGAVLAVPFDVAARRVTGVPVSAGRRRRGRRHADRCRALQRRRHRVAGLRARAIWRRATRTLVWVDRHGPRGTARRAAAGVLDTRASRRTARASPLDVRDQRERHLDLGPRAPDASRA